VFVGNMPTIVASAQHTKHSLRWSQLQPYRTPEQSSAQSLICLPQYTSIVLRYLGCKRGSPWAANTIGIVFVAFLAPSTWGDAGAKMTNDTLRLDPWGMLHERRKPRSAGQRSVACPLARGTS
jgi:hypothetical protein